MSQTPRLASPHDETADLGRTEPAAAVPRSLSRFIPPLASARAMYLLYFMAWGAFAPFINLYYERLGLTGLQIGMLASLPAVVALFTSFVWGSIADAHRIHRRMLSLALLLSPLAALALSQAAGLAILIPCVLAYALFSSPIMSLLDSTALEIVNTQKRSFGEMRLWGSIGWVLSTWVVGTIIERTNIRWLFYAYVIFIGLAFVVSFFLPRRQRILRSSLASGLGRFVRRDLLVFFISIFLLGITLDAVRSFLSIYLDGIGAREGFIGLAWAVAAVCEIPMMLWSGPLIRRVGSGGLVKASFALFALCWLLYSFIRSPEWAIGLQALQGFAFAAYLTGGVTYLNDRTPEGLSTTAQAILNSIYFGLSPIVGSLLGGYLYDWVGMVNLFRVVTLMALTALVVLVLALRFSAAKPDIIPVRLRSRTL